MLSARLCRWLLSAAVCAAAVEMAALGIAKAQQDSTDLSIELVDPRVLRVCADPRNLPFSDEKGSGFENKLAELFAEKCTKCHFWPVELGVCI